MYVKILKSLEENKKERFFLRHFQGTSDRQN